MAMANVLKKMLIGRAFTTEKSRIKMFGIMDWTLYPSRGFAIMLQRMGTRLGEDFVYNLGYTNGKMNGEEMVSAMRLKPSGGWITLKGMAEILDFTGYGKVDFMKMDMDDEGHHHIIVRWKNNPTVEEGIKLYGKKSMVCSFFRGLFSGHGEVEFGAKNIKLKEKVCVKEGKTDYCEWESRW
jgi:hypothetical protein